MSNELRSKPTRSVGWAFLFALRRESKPFVKSLRFVQAIEDAPCPAALHESRRGLVLVVEMGIGAEKATRAIHWVLTEFEPRLVVVGGFAGSLSAQSQLGDVFLASEVVEPTDDLRWRTAVPAELGDLPVGRLLTANHLIATAREKRSLGKQHGAMAVDMESAAIAEACQEGHVPCAVVRVISDTIDRELSPRLASLFAGGRVSLPRVLAHLAGSPSSLIEFYRLARDSRRAARILAHALHQIIC